MRQKNPINLIASSEIKIKQTRLLSICQDYTDSFSIQNKIRNTKSRVKEKDSEIIKMTSSKQVLIICNNGRRQSIDHF